MSKYAVRYGKNLTTDESLDNRLDNLSGEKALIEERRKKLDQLRDKGSAYGNSFKPQNNSNDIFLYIIL